MHANNKLISGLGFYGYLLSNLELQTTFLAVECCKHVFANRMQFIQIM